MPTASTYTYTHDMDVHDLEGLSVSNRDRMLQFGGTGASSHSIALQHKALKLGCSETTNSACTCMRVVCEGVRSLATWQGKRAGHSLEHIMQTRVEQLDDKQAQEGHNIGTFQYHHMSAAFIRRQHQRLETEQHRDQDG